MLRVPGSGTANFDGHVAPPWCVTCPPSSAMIWRVASANFLRNILWYTTAFATQRRHGVWEHRLACGNTSWFGTRVLCLGFLLRRTRPGYGTAMGPTTWGQRCLVEGRAKPRLDRLGLTGVRTTQEWPGRTPTKTKPCSLGPSEAPIPETGEATLCRSEPGYVSPPESKTHQT